MNPILTKARDHYSKKLPFVLYSKPDAEDVIGLFQSSSELHTLSMHSRGFAFVSFDNLQRYMIPEDSSDIYFQKISSSDFYVTDGFQLTDSQTGKDSFEALVGKAIFEINNGTFEKVVLSRKEVVHVAELEFESLFSKMIVAYPNAFRYVLYHPEIGFWMGATPEQLMKIEDALLKTVSLAGTQVYKGQESSNWGAKEIQEQQIVTDYIVARLTPFADSIDVSDPTTVVAGNLAHIKTAISAQIVPENIEKIIDVLHPTPAVCGFPKAQALQFIADNEGYDRGFYAGFLGEWNKNFTTFQENQFDLYVNLRCMNYEQNSLNVYVGCGITQNSIPEMEYVETVNKAITMKKII